MLPLLLSALAWAGDTCREGLFVREANGSLRAMRVTADKSPFYRDDAPCPGEGACEAKAYLVEGDAVVASHTSGRFTCAWYRAASGKVFVGFLATDTLADARTGRFVLHENDVVVAATPTGLRVDGDAIWHGLGDNVHVGEVHGDLEPMPDGRFRVSGDGCEATFQWVGGAWAVTDNGDCGGANVSFDGVYHPG